MKDKILIGVVIALVISVALNLGTVGTVIFLTVTKTEIHRTSGEFPERLELTPEQKETLKAKREEMKKNAEPVRRELDEKRSAVIELMKEPELDAAKRDELFNEIAELQAQLEILVFDHMYETAQELTPEQREVFFEHLEGKFGPGRGPSLHGPPHIHGHRGGTHGAPHGLEGELGRHGPPPGYEGESSPPPTDTE
jgi:Spy/CpxP family protein refolding chaperone